MICKTFPHLPCELSLCLSWCDLGGGISKTISFLVSLLIAFLNILLGLPWSPAFRLNSNSVQLKGVDIIHSSIMEVQQ